MRQTLLIFLCVYLLLPLGGLLAQSNSRIERLENLLKLSQMDTSKVRYLNLLYVEYEADNPLKAKKYAEQALSLAQQNNYTTGIMISAGNVGAVYHKQGAYPKALEYFELSLNIKRNLNNPKLLTEAYNQIANTLVLQGNINQAIDYYTQALKINEEFKDSKGIATNYTNLGGAYYKRKEYDTSIKFHVKAIELSDSLNNKTLIAYNFERLGETYFRIQEYDNALRCYQQLLQIGKSESNRNYRKTAYQGLSQIFAEQDDYRKAYENYQKYMDEKESIFKELQNEALKNISNTQTELNNVTEIKDLQQEKFLAQEETLSQRTWFFSIIIVLILTLTLILYFNNRRNHRANLKLLEQQKVIEEKNKALEGQQLKISEQNTSIQRKNQTLETTFQEIERKNKDITASINYAKRIQESMLSRDKNFIDVLPEYFVFYRPRDIVSGDFYWFAYRENKTFVAAVDCTGHGVPGAIMSMLGDSYLNQIINLQGITKPDLILAELHKSIQIALNQENNNNQDGMDVALCVIDRENKVLEYSGASRELFIIQEDEYRAVESTKLPIGGFQKDRPREFETLTFNLNKPTWVYIYSDGFQDQFGGPRGRKFAKSRLHKTLYSIYKHPMNKQKELLERTLEDWMGQNRQMDDIMIVGLKL
jgi:serine phosphatase RsbU (regulator of sigma subunit)